MYNTVSMQCAVCEFPKSHSDLEQLSKWAPEEAPETAEKTVSNLRK